jgi:hypothetical protein
MADGGGDNVKVAVRMRPFNDREKKLDCKICIRMVENQTAITNPEDGTWVRPLTAQTDAHARIVVTLQGAARSDQAHGLFD